jgi:hypothetical protein
MSTYQNEYDSLFESTYLEIFYEYNPILGKERELALRRQLGEEGKGGEDLHLFGGEETGCCRRRTWCIGGVLMVCTIGIVLLFHYVYHFI